jgi:carbamoyl-phosphate synthase large subunit
MTPVRGSNILISSAGRRVELVEAFKAALGARAPAARVHATDLAPEFSAACHVAHVRTASLRATDPAFASHLLDYCVANEIGLVVPTIDTELAPLAAARAQFQERGIVVSVSSPALIAACRDKRQTGHLLARFDIAYPAIYPADALKYPCFAKPIGGSSSIGARLIATADDMSESLRADPSMMFMEYIDKRFHEVTVDAYYDAEGALRCLVPRRRLEVRAGEVSKGVTRRGGLYTYLLERLGMIRGARGCLTVQMFVDEVQRRYIGLEINPRFGGGYPLSEAAGASFTRFLVDEVLFGQAVPFFDGWQANLLMLRYDGKVLVSDA